MVEKTELSPNLHDWWSQIYAPFQQLGHRVAEYFAPSAEAAGNDEAYVINLELPGVAESDIAIELLGGRLKVTGEKRSEREEQGQSYFFSERVYGRFQRSFTLPKDVDPEAVTASHKDGLLTIRLGKTQSLKPAAKSIQIETG